MKLISDGYLALQLELHKNPDYGTTGAGSRIWKFTDSRDVLDYGCGKKTFARGLGFSIQNYDPCVEGCNDREPAELVVCTDVMEHIEPEFLDAVLADMASLTLDLCYMTIATHPAIKTLADGRNAHLIQQDAKWWLERISEHFDIDGCILWPRGFEVLARRRFYERSKVLY